MSARSAGSSRAPWAAGSSSSPLLPPMPLLVVPRDRVDDAILGERAVHARLELKENAFGLEQLVAAAAAGRRRRRRRLVALVEGAVRDEPRVEAVALQPDSSRRSPCLSGGGGPRRCRLAPRHEPVALAAGPLYAWWGRSSWRQRAGLAHCCRLQRVLREEASRRWRNGRGTSPPRRLRSARSVALPLLRRHAGLHEAVSSTSHGQRAAWLIASMRHRPTEMCCVRGGS